MPTFRHDYGVPVAKNFTNGVLEDRLVVDLQAGTISGFVKEESTGYGRSVPFTCLFSDLNLGLPGGGGPRAKLCRAIFADLVARGVIPSGSSTVE